jgi:rhodanese-related sulfurtransferase
MPLALAKAILFMCAGFGAFFLLKQILLFFRGGPPMEDLLALKAAGAKIIDVRTPAEFAQGHVDGSVNIPLDQFEARMFEIDKTGPVLLCCASGGRSGIAKQILDRAGYPRTFNAGAWSNLR